MNHFIDDVNEYRETHYTTAYALRNSTSITCSKTVTGDHLNTDHRSSQ